MGGPEGGQLGSGFYYWLRPYASSLIFMGLSCACPAGALGFSVVCLWHSKLTEKKNKFVPHAMDVPGPISVSDF